MSLFVVEDVVRLDVSVANAFFMEVLGSSNELEKDCLDFIDFQHLSPLEDAFQGRKGIVFRHNIVLAGPFVDIESVAFEDVFVLQFFEDVEFFFDPKLGLQL